MRAIGLSLILSTAIPVLAAAAPELTDEGRLPTNEVFQRLRVEHIWWFGPIITTATGEMAERQNPPELTLYLELEPGPQQVVIDDTRFFYGLKRAAQLYAVWTEDFDVTIRELWDAGLIPYAIEGVDLDLSIPGGRGSQLYKMGLFMVGSKNWLLTSRAEVLSSFTSGLKAGDREADWERNPNFWVNPVTGQPMRPGPDMGDYYFNERTHDERGGVIKNTLAYEPTDLTFPIIHGPSLHDYYKLTYEQTKHRYKPVPDTDVSAAAEGE